MRRSIAIVAILFAAVSGCARSQQPAERVQISNVVALREAFGGGATSGAAAAVALAEPTGWATIKGKFKINGTPPPRTQLTVDKDQHVCAPGGKAVFSEELVVDSAGGIKDVVIYLAAPTKFPVGDPKWEHSSYASAREAEIAFDQKDCIFLSHMFAMRTPQKLKILNSDPTGHNTNFGAFNQLIPPSGYALFQHASESPEPISVACNIHPWMSARMLVRNSPYFAVTKSDGSFEIANVPAGVPLEFRVWQEKSKFLQDVTVNGKKEKWSKGRLKATLQPDQSMALDVVVDAAVFSK